MARKSDSIYKWPAWMPKAQQSDYSYEPVDRRSRTEMEVGSVLRVNYDTDETTLNCILILNRFESAWFEAAERTALWQGSQWIEMPIQTGGFINMHTVRFKARPKASIKAPFYTQYSLTLELEKRELEMCDSLAQFLFCFAPDEVCGVADLADTFIERMPPLQVPDFWIYGCKQKRVKYELHL